MNTAIEIVNALKGTTLGRRLTVHDIGQVDAEFVLGLKCEDEIDIWYCALDMKNHGLYLGATYWFAFKKILYFPEVKVGKEAYEVLNANG